MNIMTVGKKCRLPFFFGLVTAINILHVTNQLVFSCFHMQTFSIMATIKSEKSVINVIER